MSIKTKKTGVKKMTHIIKNGRWIQTRKTVKSHPYFIFYHNATKSSNNRPQRFKTVQDAKNYILELGSKYGYVGEYSWSISIYKGHPKTCIPRHDFIERLNTQTGV